MTKPETARELIEKQRKFTTPTALELAKRVEGALKLHPLWRRDGGDFCFECGQGWPCPTNRLLNGEPIE